MKHTKISYILPALFLIGAATLTVWDQQKAYLLPAGFLATLAVSIFMDESAARKMAKEERKKNEKLTTVCHQLRTPITSVKSYTEMLMNQELGKMQIAQMEILNKLQDDIAEASELVDRSLTIAGVEDTTSRKKERETDVREIVQAVCDALYDDMRQKKQRYRVGSSLKRLHASIDPLAAHSIFHALVHNASAYSEEGDSIEIDFDRDNSDVIVRIKDNGIGMTQADTKRIFEKHYRTKDGQKNHPEGSGLGLTIAKDLAEQAGGKIRCESKKNIGSVFFVHLPCHIDS